MDPLSLVLGAASMGGGIMQALGGRKAIDPNWLKQHFGANQISNEFIELMNSLINSPMGQKMMEDASVQGNQMQNEILRGQAMAGLGPTEGGTSGSSIFAGGAATGAGDSLRRDVQSRFAQMALPIAAENVNNRMGIVTNSLANTPTGMQQLGGLLGTAGSLGLQARGEQLANQPTPTAPRPMTAQEGASLFGGTPNMIGPGGVPMHAPSVPVAMRQPGQAKGNGMFLSRFGRKISRFGARLGNLVTPGNPFGYSQT